MNLEQALQTGPTEVLECLRGASEEERRRQAPVALRWHKALWADMLARQIQGVSRDLLWTTLPLAVLGTASLSELKKLRFFVVGEDSFASARTVLQDRRPDWLQDWAAWVLPEAPQTWPFLRELEKSGLIGRPQTDFYVLGMIAAARHRGAQKLLERDPELLREVDLLFEVEGGGDTSLAAFDKYSREEERWSTALLRLGLPRQQLLRGSLQALSRGFAPFRAGWYSRFHELLEPTLEERLAHQDLLYPLLSSTVPATVSFALSGLTQVARVQPLDPVALQRHVMPVWMLPQKGPVLACLQLLGQLPEPERLEHLSQAATHPAREVQQAALRLLRAQEPRPSGSWKVRWEELLPALEPSVQAEWSSWLETAAPEALTPVFVSAPAGNEVAAVAPCASLEEVFELAGRLLETLEPALDAERLLEALPRFQGRGTAQAPALLKRSKALRKATDLRQGLAAVLSTWLGEPAAVEAPSRSASLDGFLTQRLQELQKNLAGGSCPLLVSLPEWSDGRLSEETLAARLQGGHGEPYTYPAKLDLRQARLRLRGQEPPLDWSMQVDVSSHVVQGKTYVHRHLQVQAPKDPHLTWEPGSNVLSSVRWQALVSPSQRERYHLMGMEQIANNLDWWEANWGNRAYLETLLGLPCWTPTAALLVAFGIGCKDPAEQGLATEALAGALESRRLSPDALAEALTRAAQTGMITARRWAKAFSELRRHVSGEMLQEALEHFVAGAPAEFAVNPLLEPWLQIATALARGPGLAGARARLEGIKTGQSGKTARSLLALGPPP